MRRDGTLSQHLVPTVRVDADHQAELLREAWRYLRRRGYRHYEVSNFCLGDNRSRHNLLYWKRRPYTGLGLSAHGFDGRRRYWNTQDFDAYAARVSSGAFPEEGSETLSSRQESFEALMLGLRLVATGEAAARSAVSTPAEIEAVDSGAVLRWLGGQDGE